MELADVTVYYLEMLAPSQRDVPAPRVGLTVLHAGSSRCRAKHKKAGFVQFKEENIRREL